MKFRKLLGVYGLNRYQSLEDCQGGPQQTLSPNPSKKLFRKTFFLQISTPYFAKKDVPWPVFRAGYAISYFYPCSLLRIIPLQVLFSGGIMYYVGVEHYMTSSRYRGGEGLNII